MDKQQEIREELTKQEWVQKYLEDILGDAWRKGAHKEGIDVTEEANKARLHLTKLGAVIKVERELPEEEWTRIGRKLSQNFSFNRIDWLREPEHTSCLTELAKETEFELGGSGYVAVEPFINKELNKDGKEQGTTKEEGR